MYEKLARGHATAYVNGLQDYDEMLNWLAGPRLKRAGEAFERSSYAKKPGRVLKRMMPHLRPRFGGPQINCWKRHAKVIVAEALACSIENSVFQMSDDNRPLYSERAVFFVEALFLQDYDRVRAGVITRAAISHHAIARLVEREAVAPDDLSHDINLALTYSSRVAEMAFDTAVDQTEMQSLLLPFAQGALVAVFMDMDPARAHKSQNRRRILSVRTWLDESMLSDRDLERMGGLDDVTKVLMLDNESGQVAFRRWLEGNARPWHFSDSTLGDRAQAAE